MKDKKERVERFYKRIALKDFIILHSFIKLPENINKVDLDIKSNLEKIIRDKFEEDLNSIKLKMQRTDQKFNENEIIERIILLFDDFFDSELNNEELKQKLLKLYNYML